MFGGKGALQKALGSAFVFIVIACGVMSSPVSANHTDANGNLKSYTTDLNGAYAFGDDFCTHKYSVGDYVWITAADGGNVIKATAGDSTVGVTVHYGGRYCQKGWPTNAYSDFTSSTGSISGRTGNYGLNNDSYLRFSGSQSGTLNISRQRPGQFDVCITLTTTTNPPIARVPSPSACTKLVLEIKYPWTTAGQSLLGVNHSPNVVTWPAAPPSPEQPALPGSVVEWNHRLWNNSGYDMDRTIYWSVRQSGFSGGASWRNGNSGDRRNADPQGWDSGTANGSVDRPFVNQGPQWDATRYRVSQDDVGNTLCQWLVWTPKQGGEPIDTQPTGISPQACVSVPYRFNLVPSIDPLGREFGDQGGTIPTVNGKITNQGPTKSYVDTMWQLSVIEVKPGGNIEEVNTIDDRKDGCAFYGNKCTPINGRGSGEGDSSFGVKATVVRQLLNQQIGDLEVGSKLCYGMSVKAYHQGLTNASPDWRHSPAECVIVGKKPKVQVWGGDLTVGRRFSDDTSAPKASGVGVSVSEKENGTKTYGSWVEYGIFASAAITGASSAGLAGPNGNGSPLPSSWSKLTFANSGHTGSSGCVTEKFGCFNTAGNMGTIPDVATRLASGAVTTAPQLPPSRSLNGLNGTYYTAGNFKITDSTIQKGESVIIKAAGTVRISNDIRYTTDSMMSIDEIPQVVIIANNIIIDEGVTNVDAWLIANGTSGSIYTCGDFRNILTSKMCDKQLTINGPVMSKKLFLQRTAGSGTDTASGDPAEVLNLRTDAYLWAIGRSGGAGGIQTISTHELAPRF